MNRIAYLLKAQTQHGLHSPFLFDLYSSVLMARLPQRKALKLPRRGRRYYELLYKMANYFDAAQAWIPAEDAIAQQCARKAAPHIQIQEASDITLLQGGKVRIALMRSPHQNKQQEQRWQQLCADSRYEVTIDLYDVGIAIFRGGLHKQHFLLR